MTDLTRKAADMLLQGATLLSEPCPYCSGVRVMKDGHALCVGCGREPQNRQVRQENVKRGDLRTTLEGKLEQLKDELEKESDHAKQQEILKSINSILDAIEKLGRHSG